MEKSKVYFSDLRALPGTNLPEKLKKLIQKAGIGEIDFEKKMTAIKIHFGEPGNLSFLRPNYAKAVADVVKELGGRPFLTDCNTLYVGRRKDALEHLSAAYENGFNILSTGCHIIIGDGLKGTDDVAVPVEGGEVIKEAKIGRAIMDADVFIRSTGKSAWAAVSVQRTAPTARSRSRTRRPASTMRNVLAAEDASAHAISTLFIMKMNQP